jgi:hypothetical protein
MGYYWINRNFDYQELAWANGLPSTKEGRPDLRWHTPSGIFLKNDKPLSLFQNPVGFGTSSRKNRSRPGFSTKFKVAVPKTEVFEQPHL